VEDDLPTNAKKVMAIPALETANKKLHPRVFNVLIMGAVIGATQVVNVEKRKRQLK